MAQVINCSGFLARTYRNLIVTQAVPYSLFNKLRNALFGAIEAVKSVKAASEELTYRCADAADAADQRLVQLIAAMVNSAYRTSLAPHLRCPADFHRTSAADICRRLRSAPRSRRLLLAFDVTLPGSAPPPLL